MSIAGEPAAGAAAGYVRGVPTNTDGTAFVYRLVPRHASDASTTFASRAFRWAGIYGLIVLVPQYFWSARSASTIRRRSPPEHFYGFIGVALAWQLVFLVIATDVVRFRPLMLPAIVEKLAFSVPVLVLYAQGRVAASVVGVGLIDLALGTAFAAAWLRTAPGRG